MLLYSDCDQAALHAVLRHLGLEVTHIAEGVAIPGSFWGDEEAGLIGSKLYLRDDTPVHSVLHESCHYACMDEKRRAVLHTNAGGNSAEENAVCYLQILLSDALPDMGRTRMFSDMDAWGYSFRLGSSQSWFEQDACEAKEWLEQKQLLSVADQLAHANS